MVSGNNEDEMINLIVALMESAKEKSDRLALFRNREEAHRMAFNRMPKGEKDEAMEIVKKISEYCESDAGKQGMEEAFEKVFGKQ